MRKARGIFRQSPLLVVLLPRDNRDRTRGTDILDQEPTMRLVVTRFVTIAALAAVCCAGVSAQAAHK